MDIDLGHDFYLKTFAVDSTGVNVTITKAFKTCYLQSRGENDVQLRRVSTDSDFITMKGGGGIKLSIHVIPDSGVTATICHLKTGAGVGETVEAIFTY